MTVRCRLTGATFATADDLLAAMGWVDDAASPLAPFDDRATAFLGELSGALLRGAGRRHPELVALGYFLRPSELTRLASGVADGADTVRAPRGLVLHVPPANVDTIFVYSWALSLLAGNANVVRLSERTEGAAADALLAAVAASVAAADPVIAQGQRIVSYGHDDAVTAALSARCDMRVLWGGDAAVDRLRRFPLPPRARELTFPDRFSMAAVGAHEYLAMDDGEREQVAVGLFNDAYWFDQAACASPRLVVIVGTDDEAATCRRDLFDRLAAVIDGRGYRVDTSMAVEKRTAAAALALDGLVDAVDWRSNELVVLDGHGPVGRRHGGAGAFQVRVVRTLADVVPFVGRREQTLAHAGLAADELRSLARALNGCGIDRIVPIGQALSFGVVWDGEHLLDAFSRRVSLLVR